LIHPFIHPSHPNQTAAAAAAAAAGGGVYAIVVVLQSILHDVEQFQSEVTSVLSAEQLNADSVQELLQSEIMTKLDLPEHKDLLRVMTALLLLQSFD